VVYLFNIHGREEAGDYPFKYSNSGRLVCRPNISKKKECSDEKEHKALDVVYLHSAPGCDCPGNAFNNRL
jgi:hypothetical protein